jgi:hypothetical protein
MPTQLHYYLVRYVDLKNGKFYEEEMSETQLETLELAGKLTNSIQILNKTYLRTKDLTTGAILKLF